MVRRLSISPGPRKSGLTPGYIPRSLGVSYHQVSKLAISPGPQHRAPTRSGGPAAGPRRALAGQEKRHADPGAFKVISPGPRLRPVQSRAELPSSSLLLVDACFLRITPTRGYIGGGGDLRGVFWDGRHAGEVENPRKRRLFSACRSALFVNMEVNGARCAGGRRGATSRRSRPTDPSADSGRREEGSGGGPVVVRGPPGGRGPEKWPKTSVFGGGRRAGRPGRLPWWSTDPRGTPGVRPGPRPRRKIRAEFRGPPPSRR